MTKANKGFTVVELLLVIGLIGILVAVMLGSMSGSADSARAARCLSNLHNLANASQTVAMNTGFYPLAGSRETKHRYAHTTTYGETPGWISWASMQAYRGATAHKASSSWFISTYDTTLDKRTYALTNGAIWQAISGNASTFVCPSHTKYAKRNKVTPIWSYVMNAAFGWDDTEGAAAKKDVGCAFNSIGKGDRKLFFAELPYNTDNTAQTCSFTTAPGRELDPTLQYGGNYNEVIGFNHKDGKKWYAHVCFADGHAEKLELPKNVGVDEIRKLTNWLCEGADVSYNGTKYEELE